MHSRRRSLFFPAVFLAASAALVVPSCGGDEGAFGKRYGVSGTVSYNGQPLARGTISFVPATGAGASGVIDQGTYALSTGGSQDGALPGQYKVTVTSTEDTEAQAKAEFAKVSKRPEAEITAVPRQFLANAAAKAKSLIPAGYGDVRTTTLTAEVKESSNTISFTLSDTDAPPEPSKPKAGKSRR